MEKLLARSGFTVVEGLIAGAMAASLFVSYVGLSTYYMKSVVSMTKHAEIFDVARNLGETVDCNATVQAQLASCTSTPSAFIPLKRVTDGQVIAAGTSTGSTVYGYMLRARCQDHGGQSYSLLAQHAAVPPVTIPATAPVWISFPVPISKCSTGGTPGVGAAGPPTYQMDGGDGMYLLDALAKSKGLPYGRYSSGQNPRHDATTIKWLCQAMGYTTYTGSSAAHWDSPSNNWVIWWNNTTNTTVRQNGGSYNSWFNGATCSN